MLFLLDETGHQSPCEDVILSAPERSNLETPRMLCKCVLIQPLLDHIFAELFKCTCSRIPICSIAFMFLHVDESGQLSPGDEVTICDAIPANLKTSDIPGEDVMSSALLPLGSCKTPELMIKVVRSFLLYDPLPEVP